MPNAEPSELRNFWGPAPALGIYRIEANLGEKGGEASHPIARIATQKNKGDAQAKIRQRLFDPSCLTQLEIPPL